MDPMSIPGAFANPGGGGQQGVFGFDAPPADPAARPTAADAASSVEHALDRDVVRALKASGKGDATVVLRAPNGDVRVYSDEGVFISEEKARTSSDPAAAPPRAVSDSTS